MEYSDDYLTFYQIYPRHEGKADGQKAWSSLTEGDRKAARADVEKRKRMGAYSQNKKLIQLPASYLRAGRWEDDWQETLESSRKGDDLPNSGPVAHVPEHTPDLPWQERLLNRLFRNYVFVGMGLPEVDTALKIKYQMLKSDVPAIDEDLQAGTETLTGAAKTIAELFVGRLDQAYDRDLKTRVLQFSRRVKA